MLCKYCTAFDYDQLITVDGYPHHETASIFDAAVDSGCEICQVVSENPKFRGRQSFPMTCNLTIGGLEASRLIWLSPLRIELASLRPFTEHGDELSHMFAGRVVNHDLFSESSTCMMKDWLNHCGTNHTMCPKQADHILPTRVIDVGNSEREPRLIISGGTVGKWVTLSHCWGSSPPLTTETSTLKSRCRSISLGSLPPTFRDAVLITRNLGVHYLWVDSLCILQDSQQDWLRESPEMGRVFKHALVIINADAAVDSSIGIIAPSLQYRKSRRQKMLKTRLYSTAHNFDSNIFLGTSTEYWLSENTRGPLGLRGWTLQEEVLAPRILHFTDSILIWRCVEEIAPETLPGVNGVQDYHEQPIESYRLAKCYSRVLDFSPFTDIGDAYMREVLQYWYSGIVDCYMERHLTYKRGKLMASAGIAKEFQPSLDNSTYVAGLWRADIHRGLLWSPFRSQGSGGAARYKEYISPSWSWASIEFAIPTCSSTRQHIYGQDLFGVQRDIEPLAKIVGISIKNVNDDPFGQVESASLELKAEAKRICSCRVPVAFLDERNDHIKHASSSSHRNLYNHGELEHAKTLPPIELYPGGIELGDVRVADFPELRMKLAGTQACIKDREIKHEKLIYVKVARLNQSFKNIFRVVVAGLILKPVEEQATQAVPQNPSIVDRFHALRLVRGELGSNARHVRVGRVLMKPDPKDYSSSKMKFMDEAWPVETFTII